MNGVGDTRKRWGPVPESGLPARELTDEQRAGDRHGDRDDAIPDPRDAPGSGVGGAHVTTVRPDNTAQLPAAGVNIFLYQVTPNLAFQNADLPTRRADGTLIRRPQAALDLHYLLTFYGDDATLDQQRLLGATVLELHAAPVLSREVVRQVQNYVPFLNGSNLADQIDVVRVRPANLSLEDMNKLWMTFPNVDYVLSVVYIAGVVLIETDDLTAGAGAAGPQVAGDGRAVQPRDDRFGQSRAGRSIVLVADPDHADRQQPRPETTP